MSSGATAIKLPQDSLWDFVDRVVAKTPEIKAEGKILEKENSISSLSAANDGHFAEIRVREHVPDELPAYLTDNKAHLLAGVFNTRESWKRTLLEVTGFELPELAAAILSKRPKANLVEILARSLYLTSVTAFDPKINSFFLRIVGKILIPEEYHKDILHIARFQREDLENLETFKEGLNKLKTHEINDQHFLAKMSLTDTQRDNAVNGAAEIKDFTERFVANEDTLKVARAIKNIGIMSASVAGILYGFMPIFNNVIVREKLLGQTGFTGVDSNHREKFKGFKPIQKFGMAFGMLSGGLVNGVLLPISNMKNTKFAQQVKKWQDLTHGIYPKLGLLLSGLAVPINISRISASMSGIELFENIMTLSIVATSWAFGHKLTEDQLSKLFNNRLKDRYNLNEDILIKTHKSHGSEEVSSKAFPESSEIQEILEKTQHNKDLQRDAIKYHTWRTWLGVTGHSLLVFIARMFMNSITKKIVNAAHPA